MVRYIVCIRHFLTLDSVKKTLFDMIRVSGGASARAADASPGATLMGEKPRTRRPGVPLRQPWKAPAPAT